MFGRDDGPEVELLQPEGAVENKLNGKVCLAATSFAAEPKRWRLGHGSVRDHPLEDGVFLRIKAESDDSQRLTKVCNVVMNRVKASTERSTRGLLSRLTASSFRLPTLAPKPTIGSI
jgi:hypothetical protein